MMPTIEETITPDIQAQLEHEEWSRDQERQHGKQKQSLGAIANHLVKETL